MSLVNVNVDDKDVNVNNKDINVDNKTKIIALFMDNVKNKEIIINKNTHCGSEGHWLETQMGINHNGRNEPDLFGYEMKKESKKITFGDFSASEYLFSVNKVDSIINKINNWNCIHIITREQFIKYFGNKNSKKHNRYSWSGSCIPKYNNWNSCGQTLIFDDDNNLCIYYDHSKDIRPKDINIPEFLQNGKILIAIWKREKLEMHINKKFNKNGFFICKKNKQNTYQTICFGEPFNFNLFVDNIIIGNIYFDSGMYNGNNRNYSQFRSNLSFWNLLITETY